MPRTGEPPLSPLICFLLVSSLLVYGHMSSENYEIKLLNLMLGFAIVNSTFIFLKYSAMVLKDLRKLAKLKKKVNGYNKGGNGK